MYVVGHNSELSTICAALEASLVSRAALIAVEGEAGIGKTVLVTEALRLVSTHGSPKRAMRTAKADELAGSTPFATLVAALGVARDLTGDALLSTFADAAAAGPLALFIDDAHWLDRASLLLLDRVLDELADHPLAVVLALRPVPHPPELARLVSRSELRTHVVLAPLPRDQLEALVTAEVPLAEVANVPLARAGGNPFYAIELARSAVGDAAGTSSGSTPPLSVTILRRLSYLGVETLAVLRQAALLGTVSELRDVVVIADRPERSIIAAVEQATRAGVLRAEGPNLRFSHDLVRAALYDDAPLAIRRFEHARIGAALAAAGRSPSLVATHMELGASGDDEVAAGWLRAAAVDVAPRSAEASIDLFARALAVAGPDPLLRAELRAGLCEQLSAAGRYEEVVELARPALEATPPTDVAVAMTIALAQAHNARGQAAEACRLLEERAEGASLPDRVRLIGMLATTRLTNGDAAEADRAAQVGLALAEESGSAHWRNSALATRSWLVTGAGDAREGVRLASATIVPDVDELAPFSSVFNRLALGAALLEEDRLDEATSTFRHAVDVSDASGVAANVTLAHLGIALCAYARGDLDEAMAEAETALRIAELRSNRTSDLYALGLSARIALHRNGPAGAADLVTAARDRLADSGPGLGAEVVVWALAIDAEARGDVPDLDLLHLVWSFHPLRYLLTWRCIAPDLVRLALRAERRDIAEAVTADVAAVARIPSFASGRGHVAARCRALVDRDEAAIAADEPSARPLERAAAHVDAAGLALAAGARKRATEHLREALRGWTAAGATAEVDAVVDLARTHRIRLEAPARSLGAASTTLTTTERRVAQLAVEGLTNRAIGSALTMSRHTVDTHLRHVYQKLGINGRVELARRLSR